MDDTKKAPAEPEVLWSCPETSVNGYTRFTQENGWEWWTGRRWDRHPQDTTLVYQELARRLLAERAEQERLDDHNDKLEADDSSVQQRLSHHQTRLNIQARRLTELDENLAREVGKVANLEQDLRLAKDAIAQLQDHALSRYERSGTEQVPPDGLTWDRKRNCMMGPDERAVLDLSDYDNLNPKEHDLLEGLADLWRAWGPDGCLRERLTEARYSGVDTSSAVPGWFLRLRSELLAKPWKEGA